MTADGIFTVFVRGEPASKGNLRAFTNRRTGGAVVTERQTGGQRAWQSAVNFVLQARWQGAPIEGAVMVRLDFVFLRPPSVPERKRRWPSVKPDADKIARAVLDAMTGICFRDDAQVVDLRVQKDYGPEAGVMISVATLEGS